MSTSLPERGYQFRTLIQLYVPALLFICAVAITGVAYRDYSAWYALGAGGIPHNIIGWSLQSIARLLCSRDLRSTSCYDRYLSEEQRFLDVDLPAWEGEAPKTGLWAAPHRQLGNTTGEQLKNVRLSHRVNKYSEVACILIESSVKSVQAILNNLSDSNPHLFVTGPSTIEGVVPAIFIAPGVGLPKHQRFPRSPREIYHTHTTEGSSHALLSPADAKLVIQRGWGERHGLSGKLRIPLSFVMIFAPRNDTEVQIVERIVRAAAQYGLNGKVIL